MKRLILLLSFAVLLTSCNEAKPVLDDSGHSQAETLSEAPPSFFSPEKKEDKSKKYKPDKGMTAEELVEVYFEQQYIAYSELTYVDLSEIIDIRPDANKNMVNWLKLLARRRKLLAENSLCYVETEMFPYSIEYEEAVEDNRMEVWKKWLEREGTAIVHFRIRGEEGKAYPPIMAVNSLHSILFQKLDGEWKIAMHYFPGSVRKFTRAGTITVPTESEMLDALKLEFADEPFSNSIEIPANAVEYSADSAVEYAKKYTETKNPDFNDLGDWIGNCANFVSQAVWAGFSAGNAMTGEWYAGSPPWVHVNYFWNYITDGYGLGGQELNRVSALKNGDIVQIRTASQPEEPDRYTHMLIVVDSETLMLAQNTPAAFVYYSDLVNVQTRMIRPVYLLKWA